MAIVGYSGPGEYGGHKFQQDDGSEFVSFGDEAGKLAASFATPAPAVAAPDPSAGLYPDMGAAPAGPDMRTAQAAPAAGPSPMAQAMGAQQAAPQQAADWRAIPADTPGSKFNKWDAVGRGQATPGLEAGVDAVLTGGGGRKIEGTIPRQGDGGGGTGGGLPAGPPARVSMPGSPGVSQGQLKALSTQGVEMPGSSVTETSGIIPRNPELEASYYDAAIDLRMMREKQRDADMAHLDVQAERAKREAADERNQAIIKQAEADSHRATAAQKVEYLKRFDTALQAREVNPDRFFESRGTWSRVAAAVSVALGAYAATLSGGKNQAMEILHQSIADDIDAQKAQYAKDRDARNNLVADLDRVYGDIDEAVEAAKAIQMKAALAHGREITASDGRAEVARGFDNFEQDLRMKMIEREEALFTRSMGNTTSRQVSSIEYPRAASGGGSRPLTDKEQTAWWKDQAERTKAQREIRGEGGDDKTQAQTIGYAKERVKYESASAAIADAIGRLESQKKKYGDSWLGVPGTGLVYGDKNTQAALSALGSERGADGARNLQVISNGINLAVESNKGPASDQDIERKLAQVKGAGTAEEIVAGLRDLKAMTDAKNRALAGGYGKGVVNRYERQQQEVDVKNYRDKQNSPEPR